MNERDARERSAQQRKHAIALAKIDSVATRRASLKKQITGITTALNQPHLSAEHRSRLLAGKAELAAELHRLGLPSERDNLQSRLDEIEDQLANAKGLASSKMLELIATREQLITDLERFEK